MRSPALPRFHVIAITCWITIRVFVCRLRAFAVRFSDGERFLRGFSGVTSLDNLPHIPGDEWLMLAQWFPLILQDGEGILAPGPCQVCDSGLSPRFVPILESPPWPCRVSGVPRPVVSSP